MGSVTLPVCFQIRSISPEEKEIRLILVSSHNSPNKLLNCLNCQHLSTEWRSGAGYISVFQLTIMNV